LEFPAFDFEGFFKAEGGVQKINQTPSQVNEIAVRVYDVDSANLIAKNWRQFSSEKILSWDEVNANFLSVFKIQNATRHMMVAVIIIVAGFGIYNILNMVVTQKRKEIAILRSMGYETKDVVILFLSQGIILGIIGGLLGLIAGFWICKFLETIPFAGGPMGSGSGFLNISFDIEIYIKGMFLAIFAASFASLLPARVAGRMQPIDIIRAGAE
jgi:lipoprotein-releasing system permease protein